MSDVLAKTCDGPDCKSFILGAEELFVRDVPEGWDAQPFEAVLASYGIGIEADLNAAAIAAGWEWINSEWLCPECVARTAKIADALLRHLFTDEEIVAHSMNL
jgi:hypothetical protein